MHPIVLPQRIWRGKYNAQVATKNRAVTKERKVSQFEIELPIENGGTSYIDGEARPILKSRVICAKPGQIRRTRLPFKCYYIHLVVREGLLYDTLLAMPNFIELSNPERIRNIFQRLCTCYAAESAEQALLQQSLVLELVYAIRCQMLSGKVGGSNQAIEKAIAYIQNNLTSDLCLEKLASEVSFAPSYFHKLFKAFTGKPLHKYIEDLRIRQATHLLITTEMTLTQIAYECGFSSQSYFSYAFKRHTGMTPRVYAKKIMADYDGSPSMLPKDQ